MSKAFVTHYGDVVECSEQAIIRLNNLTAMHIDFQGLAGEHVSPEVLENFLNFLEEQLYHATVALSHLQGLKTEHERSTIVNMYLQTIEMAFQRDEPFRE